MSDRGDAITAQVRSDVLDHLRDFQKHGPRYIEEYVESIVGTQTTKRPASHLHPKLAELVRDLAMDAAVMDRRACGAAPPLSNPRDGVVSVGSSRRVAA